jgi:hypothetical protein
MSKNIFIVKEGNIRMGSSSLSIHYLAGLLIQGYLLLGQTQYLIFVYWRSFFKLPNVQVLVLVVRSEITPRMMQTDNAYEYRYKCTSTSTSTNTVFVQVLRSTSTSFGRWHTGSCTVQVQVLGLLVQVPGIFETRFSGKLLHPGYF